MDYASAMETLGKRDSRKLANNTYLQWRGPKAVAVKLHDTDVLTFTKSGSVILDSGGWQTVTTKDRMNKYLPNGWRVYSERGSWGLYGDYGWDDRVSDYRDGITITRFGNVRNGPPVTVVSREEKFRKAVGDFARDYTAKLRDGEIGAPGGGDCWHCLMFDQNLEPGGRSTSTEHLRSHVEERYYVPSLICNAFRAMGDGGARTQGVMAIMEGEDAGFYQDVALRDAPRAIRRYILKSCGMAA